MIKTICSDELEQVLKPNFMKALKSSGLKSFSFSEHIKTLAYYQHKEIVAVLVYRELESHLAEIDFVATGEPFKRKGYARALIFSLEQVYAEIWLELSAENKAALSFYEVLGFKQQSERKDYYGPGVNALNMVKRVVL